jgi:hypothetical protein
MSSEHRRRPGPRPVIDILILFMFITISITVSNVVVGMIATIVVPTSLRLATVIFISILFRLHVVFD